MDPKEGAAVMWQTFTHHKQLSFLLTITPELMSNWHSYIKLSIYSNVTKCVCRLEWGLN